VLYIAMTLRANKATELVNAGVRGRADVLELTQTGTYINDQPRVKMRLRIEAPGVTAFETEDTVTVPLIALGSLQPGRALTVVLDPADPKRYVIDWAGNSGGPVDRLFSAGRALGGSVRIPGAADPPGGAPGLTGHRVQPPVVALMNRSPISSSSGLDRFSWSSGSRSASSSSK